MGHRAMAIPLMPTFDAYYALERMCEDERGYYWMVCNWKIALDAFQEDYHARYIHPETNSFADYVDNPDIRRESIGKLLRTAESRRSAKLGEG